MANIIIHDSHERTVNVREMDKHRPLFRRALSWRNWILQFAVEINSDEKLYYLTLKRVEKKCLSSIPMRQQIIQNQIAYLYKQTTLRACDHRNGEIFWYFRETKIAHPFCVCLFLYWIGMQVPLLLFISLRLGAKKTEYVCAPEVLRHYMEHDKLGIRFGVTVPCSPSLSHGLNSQYIYIGPCECIAWMVQTDGFLFAVAFMDLSFEFMRCMCVFWNARRGSIQAAAYVRWACDRLRNWFLIFDN